MTPAFIWKGYGNLLVYYRWLHKCTICTMLERVQLRFAGVRFYMTLPRAIGIVLENSGRLFGTSRRVPGYAREQ